MKNIKKYVARYFRKSFLFCIVLSFCLVLALLIVINSFLSVKELSRSHWTTSIDMIDQRMNSIIYEINNFPRYAGNDMVFLSKLSSIVESDKNKLEQDFLSFLSENTAYYKLTYVNEQGVPQVLVEFDGKNYQATRNFPQNPFPINLPEKANKLGRDEVYISPIELSQTSDGELENRGTTQAPLYVPIIIYATPVFTEGGKRVGFIAASVYADYFLDDIRSFGREEEEVFLIDNQGHYLAHANRNREFAHFLGREDNFQKDYPQVANQIISGSEKRLIETKDNIFSFRYIYPSKGSFAIFKGDKKLNGAAGGDYYWVMVSVVNAESLRHTRENITQGAALFVIASLLLVGCIAGIGCKLALNYKYKQSKDAI